MSNRYTRREVRAIQVALTASLDANTDDLPWDTEAMESALVKTMARTGWDADA